MSKSNSNKSQNSNSQTRVIDGRRHRRKIVGHRLVAMQADQVDEIARAEGRGQHPTVVDKRLRCPWCLLKGGVEGNHFCRWRTESGERPVGGPVLKFPVYQWVPDE
jgi:hypothetical protein